VQGDAAERERQEAARVQKEQAEARRAEETRQRQQAATETARREQQATAATAAAVPSPAVRPVSSSTSVIRHDIQVKAPEIAENGAVVPVEITFNPPLQAGEGVDVRVNGALATALVVQEGQVATWLLRLQFPASGTVQVQAGSSTAEKFVKVTVGGSLDSMANVALFTPEVAGSFKIRTTTGDTRLLLSGALKAGRLLVSGSGFRVAVSGSPYVARNPYFGFKGSVREGDNIRLSMVQ